MNRILVLIFFVVTQLCSFCVNAQDFIIKHNGDIITCEVTAVTDQMISFRYPQETLINQISLLDIKVVELSSGRKIQGAPRTYVRGAFDWEKVNVVNDLSYAEGLEFVCDIQETAISITDLIFGEYGLAGDSQLEVLEEVKRTAAQYGCHLLVIIDGISLSTGDEAFLASAALVAKAYRYKDLPEIYPHRIIAAGQDIKVLLYDEQMFRSLSIMRQYLFLGKYFSDAMYAAIVDSDSIGDLEFLMLSSQVASIIEYVEANDFSQNQKNYIIETYDKLMKKYNSKLNRLKKRL